MANSTDKSAPAPTDTGDGAEAIVFIAGRSSREPDDARDRLLIAGLMRYADAGDPPVQIEIEPDEVRSGALLGRRLRVRRPGGPTKTLDVYEAFWGDLRGDLSGKPLEQRWWETTTLLGFWRTTPRTLDRGLRRRILGTAALLLGWYAFTLVTVLVALLHKPEDLGLAAPLTDAVKAGGAALASRSPGGAALVLHWLEFASGLCWAALGALFFLLRVGSAVDASDFTRRYLEDCLSRAGGPLQRRIRRRLSETLSAVCASERRYRRVTVVAHSLGALVATDLLAHAPISAPPAPPLRLVTLGGSLPFLGLRAPIIPEQYVPECFARVEHWTDFYAPSDWLASDDPVMAGAQRLRDGAECFQSVPLELPASRRDQVTGRTHLAYFSDATVNACLLGVTDPASGAPQAGNPPPTANL